MRSFGRTRIGDQRWRRGNKVHRVLSTEQLEPRQVLAAAPIISEFMAVNDSTLKDVDGDYSDWIELFNSGDESVDLFGYSLTDDATNLTKWRLPHVTLNAGERRVVFASNKDREDPAGELHTNFRLTSDGEYLALVAPDGKTVIQDFGPSYPPQVADVAYGISSTSQTATLLAEPASVRYHVPTTNVLQETWFSTAFVDAAWSAGTTPIGFDDGSPEQSSFAQRLLALNPLGYWRFEENAGTSAANDGTLGSSLDAMAEGGANMNFSGPNASVHPGLSAGNSAVDLDGSNDAVTTDDSLLSDLGAFTMMGFIRPDDFSANRVGLFGQNDAVEFGFISPTTLQVWTPGGGSVDVSYPFARNEWHHVAVVGTGSQLKVYLDGAVAGTGGGNTGNYGSSNFNFSMGGGGIFDATGNFFNGGLDEVAVFNRALTDTEIQELMSAATDDNDFSAILATDVESTMKGKSPSLWLRTSFNVDDPSRLASLTLRMKYDDGFVAYLNGSEIERVNAPGEDDVPLPWNAVALSLHPDSEATSFQEFDITDARDSLRVGSNVLAIHVLNAAIDNSDLLASPELLGTIIGADPSQAGYLTTPTPGGANPPSVGGLGPLVRDVENSPEQPVVGDTILVTAEVSATLAPVSTVTLTYRVMYGAEQQLPMVDNGTNGDAVAGDGVFTAIIPANIGQPGEMVRWYVSARDTQDELGRNPAFEFNTGRNQTPQYHGTMYADPTVSSEIPILHWFVERASSAGTRSGTRASLYYNGEFYDNLFVRQRGGSTAGNPKTNFKFDFKGDTFRFDERFPRVEEFNLNSTASDKAYVRQPMAFEAYAAIGTPSSISFPMHVRRNNEFYGVFAFIEEPDEEMLERNGLDPDGALYKFYNEFTSASGARKKTREYENSADLAEFVREVNRLSGTALANYLYDNVDIPTTLNYLVGTVITHQNDNPHKNHFLYRDSNGSGEWLYIPWDHDLTWGSNWVGTSYSDEIYADDDSVAGKANNIQPSHPFINTSGHREWNNHWNRLMDALLNVPSVREMFLRRLRTAMDQLLGEPGTTDSYLDRRFDEYLASTKADAQMDAAIWANPRWSWGSNQSMTDAINIIKTEYLEVRRQHLYVTHGVDSLNPGATTTIIPEFADSKYMVPIDNSLGKTWTALNFNDSTWQAGQTGVGFQNSDTSGYGDLLKSIIRPIDFAPTATSIFVRVPFQVNDPAAIENLTLRMKVDDGFVAYINGVEVARARLRDGTTNFDSRAGGQSNTAAMEFENFVLSLKSNPGLLRAGTNVLAIHGMNSSATSSDMLIMPELVDGIISSAEVAGIPHAQEDYPAIRFDQADYEAHPVSGNQDEEYLKLDNPTDQAVDISGWKLTGGVEHVFKAGTVIPAGGSLYVSPNVRTFRARTAGPSGNQGLFVQGNYRGHLSRLGDTVNLQAGDGTAIDAIEIPVEPTEVQQFLRVTEVHYNPPGFEDATEFIELRNLSSTTTLNLSGVAVTDGPGEPFVFAPGKTLAPNSYLLLVNNTSAFTAAYPSVPANLIAGEFVGGLANGGERIKVEDAEGNTVVDFDFSDNDPWPVRTDGAGATLTLKDTSVPVSQLDKWYNWSGSVAFGGTPGRDSLATHAVVINEVLANSEGPQSDGIELHNTSTQPVNVGGWYLSDSSDNFLKYRIPDGTIIAGGGYLAIRESAFNPTPNNPAPNHFALSSSGDDVWLVIPNGNGGISQFVDDVHFGPTRTNESIGRFPNLRGRLVPASAPSFGAENGASRPGELVLSEIQYHPSDPSSDVLAIDPLYDARDLEFIEVFNPTNAPINLNGWRLRGGADFDFADGTVIQPQETIVVLRFNPESESNASRLAGFLAQYQLDPATRLVGGYSGSLSDSFDRVQIQASLVSTPGQNGDVLRYFVDEALYDDAVPWPTSADGRGRALHRLDVAAPGNNPAAWIGLAPSPGQYAKDAQNGDLNGDGKRDAADIDLLCSEIRSGMNRPEFDLDQNGTVDMQDHHVLIFDYFNSTIGDANLDGIFNSTDFIVVFLVGEYEDGVPGNSGWADGDWNCDGEFDSSDFVASFLQGDYIQASVPNRDAVAASDSPTVPWLTNETAGRKDERSERHMARSVEQREHRRRLRAVDDLFAEYRFDDADWRWRLSSTNRRASALIDAEDDDTSFRFTDE